MPITKITIENFKGIRDRVEIPIRPLTLLFGANSAGKSTILQAMLYLRELLERQNYDADFLVGAGSTINLGGFEQLVHGHDSTRKVRVGLTVTVDDDGLPEYHFPMWGDVDSAERLDSEFINGVKEVTVSVEVSCKSIGYQPRITGYAVSINGEEVGKIEGGFAPAELSLNTTGSFFRELFPVLFERDVSDEDIQAQLEANGPAFTEGRLFRLGKNVVPNWGQPLESIAFLAEDVSYYVNPTVTFFQLSRIFVGAGELVLKELQRIRYIGPIRIVPDRILSPVLSPNETRWSDGSAAWDILTMMDPSDAEELNNFAPMELGYKFETQWYYEVPLETTIGESIEFMRATGNVQELDSLFDIPKSEWKDLAQKLRLRIIDTHSNVEVSARDIGVGISQVLPILVGATTGGYSLLAVEQPELHIHPAVQCRLGDFLAMQVLNGQDRSLLLETHSEHLILRLLRRIREHAENSLPPGIPVIKHSDLSILYAESCSDGLKITELPVTEDGDFEKAWPKGFFEERAAELF